MDFEKYVIKSEGIDLNPSNYLSEGSNINISISDLLSKEDADTSDIYILASVYQENSPIVYKLRINLINNNGQYQGLFKIPKNSLFIAMRVYNQGFDLKKQINIPVTLNEIPKKGSLIYQMIHSKDLDEFEKYYAIDKELYPNYIAREHKNITTMINGGTPNNHIAEYLEEVEIEFTNKQGKINADDIAIFHSSMTLNYLLINEIRKARIHLDKFLKLLDSININSSTILDRFLTNIYLKLLNIKDSNTQFENDYNSIFNKLAVALNSLTKNNISLSRLILMPLDSSTIVSSNLMKVILNNSFNIAKNIKYKRDKYALSTIPDFFWILAEKLYYNNQLEKSITVLSKGIEIFDINFREQSSNISNQRLLVLGYNNGIYSSMKNKLADLYLISKDTLSAISLYEDLIKTDSIHIYNRGPVIFAAHNLCAISISIKKIIDAQKYLSYSFILDDPRFNKLYKEFTVKFGMDKSQEIEKLIGNKKYSKLTLKNDIKRVNTNKGEINIDDFKNKYVFLIALNEECIACNLNIERFINDAINKAGKNSVFIFLSYDKIEIPEKYKKSNLFYFSNELELITKYNENKILPFMLIIYNKQVLHKLNNFPATFYELLEANK